MGSGRNNRHSSSTVEVEGERERGEKSSTMERALLSHTHTSLSLSRASRTAWMYSPVLYCSVLYCTCVRACVLRCVSLPEKRILGCDGDGDGDGDEGLARGRWRRCRYDKGPRRARIMTVVAGLDVDERLSTVRTSTVRYCTVRIAGTLITMKGAWGF